VLAKREGTVELENRAATFNKLWKDHAKESEKMRTWLVSHNLTLYEADRDLGERLANGKI
jgi:hypothetical protein